MKLIKFIILCLAVCNSYAIVANDDNPQNIDNSIDELNEVCHYFKNNSSRYAPLYRSYKQRARQLFIQAVITDNIDAAEKINNAIKINSAIHNRNTFRPKCKRGIPVNMLINGKTLLDVAQENQNNTEEMRKYLRDELEALTSQELEEDIDTCMKKKDWLEYVPGFSQEPYKKAKECVKKHKAHNREASLHFIAKYEKDPMFSNFENLEKECKKRNMRLLSRLQKNIE